MPEQDAVLAITSGVRDMQAVLNVAWQHLLPGMGVARERSESSPVKERLAALNVTPPQGQPGSPTGKRISGRSFHLEPNEEKFETASFTARDGRVVISLRDGSGEQRIECGSDEWLRGKAPMPNSLGGGPVTLSPFAARGAWESNDTYTARLCFYETPFVQTVTCKFAGDQVTITRKMNVGFGPTDRPALVGKAG